MKDALQEHSVSHTAASAFYLVDTQCRPGVDRWVNVAKVPLIRGNLSVGVHVPLTQHQRELFFGELGVH